MFPISLFKDKFRLKLNKFLVSHFLSVWGQCWEILLPIYISSLGITQFKVSSDQHNLHTALKADVLILGKWDNDFDA